MPTPPLDTRTDAALRLAEEPVKVAERTERKYKYLLAVAGITDAEVVIALRRTERAAQRPS